MDGASSPQPPLDGASYSYSPSVDGGRKHNTALIRIHSRIQVSPVIVLDVDDGCGGENGKLSATAGIRMYPDTPASGK